MSAIAVKSDKDLSDKVDRMAEAMDLMSRTIEALSEENDALRGRLGELEGKFVDFSRPLVFPSPLRGAGIPPGIMYTSSGVGSTAGGTE